MDNGKTDKGVSEIVELNGRCRVRGELIHVVLNAREHLDVLLRFVHKQLGDWFEPFQNQTSLQRVRVPGRMKIEKLNF